MKTMKLFLAAVTLVAFTATTVAQEKSKPWPVPDKEKNMKNPVAKGDASNKAGMALYNKNCASCHGKVGLGDGVKARALKTFPGDFSKADYQNQTDGELFTKTKQGRGEMPKYEGKLADNDIWNIVNYTRTFKK
ncbi:MAG TPA: c-type cytochrome [Bacteroidales bacterium]|nr:c-type cytochrome [Bacteroidales bacterium]